MSELLRLAELCEKATGPDRELDAEIASALGWQQLPEVYGPTARQWVSPENWELKSSCEGWVSEVDPPAFTGSIDAAITLVPKKGWWAVAQRCSPTSALRNFGSHNGIFRAEVGDWSDEWVAESDFPALALCAASLRASDTAGVR